MERLVNELFHSSGLLVFFCIDFDCQPHLRTLYLATLPVLCARWMEIECQQSSESQENFRILLSLTLVFCDVVTSAAKVLCPKPDSRMDTPEGKAGVIDHMKFRFSY
jgi:hypothetical protein